ncbi:MAG: hydrogenase maturation protease [Bacteroidetes bacterium]|nr:hydrogenase maturation protease [Bacteroidota bacterium]
METKNKVLILGLGNYLMCDEGVGVHFVQRLEKSREDLPAAVDLLDGGTAGFLLMNYLESYPSVIMIDATLDKNPPGTIRLIEPKFAKDFPKAMSTHEIGLKDLVESLSFMGKLPKIYLFVVSVADIASLHVGLTEEVEKAMPELRRLVFEMANQLVQYHESEMATPQAY